MASVSPLIIGLSVGGGVIILAFLGWRILKFTRRATRPQNPLPPVQMLAHDRQRLQNEMIRRSIHVNAEDERSHRLSVYHGDSPSSSVTQIVDDRLALGKRYLASSTSSFVSASNEGSPDQDTPIDRRRSYHSTRPVSVASSRPVSMRGPPHHSRVDIVLPNLLGPQSANSAVSSHRSSLYDQWMPPLNRSASRPRTLSDAGE
jgi:hypothetical protein